MLVNSLPNGHKMLKVAVLGANGFIGSRTVEMFHLENLAEVRPIVRSFTGLVLQSRFDLNWCIADAFDQSALRTAFKDCDIVIYCVGGKPSTSLKTTVPIYQAAQEAGVRRLVYISSASVHGQAPSPGTNENSPLNNRQLFAYNNARVDAERKLLKLRDKGTVELVMLRPSIVLGPRSMWITRIANELLSGEAYLVNEGKGICNSIYVDNLVHAIRLAMTADDVDGQAFLVGDQERVTWSDVYRPIAESLSIDFDQVPHVVGTKLSSNWKNKVKETIAAAVRSESAQAVFPALTQLRTAAKAAYSTWKEPSPWASPTPKPLKVWDMMALLHQCQYQLPFEKARKMLGYEPIISFPEGCRRSIAWLGFAGYPIDSWKYY